MEIKSNSKLFDVLESYPFLEEQIIHIAPPFKNLKNPVLRRTVGKLATIEKVAQIGNMEPSTLVNILRQAAGQPELGADLSVAEMVPPVVEGDPDWIAGEPQFVVDGSAMLRNGEVPVQKVNELLPSLAAGRFILLMTNFEPIPIIETMQKQGRPVFHKAHPADTGQHLTYIG